MANRRIPDVRYPSGDAMNGCIDYKTFGSWKNCQECKDCKVRRSCFNAFVKGLKRHYCIDCHGISYFKGGKCVVCGVKYVKVMVNK